ncbi:MAG: hypothetical protein ACYC08_03230, partial [Armatimonadota bacterium]
DNLPEVNPPAHLRHDVVMRAVRLQREKESRSRTFDLSALFSRLVPARTIAVAAAVAALALMIVKFPESYEAIKSKLVPGVGVVSPVEAPRPAVSPEELAAIKEQWMSRQLGRNTLWVNVKPKRVTGPRSVYRVLLNINDKALKTGESCARIGAQVYLLPPDEFGAGAMHTASLVWKGSILENGIEVPVIIDHSQGRIGTVNLLVAWRFRGRDFSQIIYIPLNSSRAPAGYSAEHGANIYGGLQAISESYGRVLIVNADLSSGRSSQVVYGKTSLDTALRATLEPIGLAWLDADSSIHVDREFPLIQ